MTESGTLYVAAPSVMELGVRNTGQIETGELAPKRVLSPQALISRADIAKDEALKCGTGLN